MSTFDDCLNFVLEREGPMTDDPNDPGGLTKFGIAQSSHPGVDVRNLTRDGASNIYHVEYWQPTHCDSLDKPAALCVFDSAVNMGCHQAIELLQAAVGANVDGAFGPQTLERYHEAAVNMPSLIIAFHAARDNAYHAKSGFNRYGNGWLNRSKLCADLAMKWTGETS